MPNINPVDLQTLGARVTDPAQLTEGRWYAVRVNCSGTHNPLVHAKYIGQSGPVNTFSVADDDYNTLKRSLGLAKCIHREDSSIRTGKINGGGVCEVFKFKQVVDEPVSIPRKSPYSIGNCRHNGIKEGDKFVVVSDSGTVAKGTIVTLTRDDGSLCPYFEVPGRKTHRAIHLWRLAPVSPTGRMRASAPAIQNIPKSVGVRPVVKEISLYEDSEDATCTRYGIKVGDKFKVINADYCNNLVSVGDIVIMSEDDGSAVPCFVHESTGELIRLRLYRLVPVVANQSNVSEPAATLGPIDQIKSEIDALNAQKQIKQEEIDKLTKDVTTIGGEVDKLKQKVADSLKDYLPEPKKANLVDWPIPNRKMQEWMEQYHSQREELTPVHLDDLIKRINHEIFTVYAVNYGAHTVRSGNIISSAEGIRGLSELTALRDYYIHLRGQLRWDAQQRVMCRVRPI